MPIDPVTGAMIAAGVNVASQGINAFSQSSLNKKTRKWNEKMYDLQRSHSLQDWQMMNTYNSPQEQMKRLKDAGLNPNLVYGKGADNIAAPVRSTDVKGWNPQAPQVNLGAVAESLIGGMYNLEMKQAQTNNVKENNNLLKAQTLKTLADAKLADTRLAQYADELAANLGLTKAKTEQTIVSNKYTLAKNEREELMTNANIEQIGEKILQMRKQNLLIEAQTKTNNVTRSKIYQEIENLKTANDVLITKGKLAQLDLAFQEMGINRNSTAYERVLARFLHDPIKGAEDIDRFIQAMKKLATAGGNSLLEMLGM